jgi:hypothetical protein
MIRLLILILILSVGSEKVKETPGILVRKQQSSESGVVKVPPLDMRSKENRCGQSGICAVKELVPANSMSNGNLDFGGHLQIADAVCQQAGSHSPQTTLVASK